MDLPIYLAMTAAEYAKCPQPPPRTAWMACHFSAYGTGLSNLPGSLPEHSLLILNDRTPIQGHDPIQIQAQLQELIENTTPDGLLIDFQRPVTEKALAVAKALSALSCPVTVTEEYAPHVNCGVFLSPVPLHIPLADYLAPWKGRDIWLEIALSRQRMTLTEKGCETEPCTHFDIQAPVFTDDTLHCKYLITVTQDQAQFALFRQKEEILMLLQQAQSYGVSRAVGLYQELGEQFYLST